jgi:hypothetical protein
MACGAATSTARHPKCIGIAAIRILRHRRNEVTASPGGPFVSAARK